MTVNAYAKINLTLEIEGKRADGYHSLTSVMAHITLADRVTVNKNSSGTVSFSATDSTIPVCDNLCTRAAKAYFEAKGISGKGVDIILENRIPTASGMGGGSADAAAVIECMESLYGRLDRSLRHKIARGLGADVPYCLEKLPCYCTGVGDECEPIECDGFDDLWIVVSKKGEKLSTAKVYGDFDSLERADIPHDHSAVVNAIESGDTHALAKGVFNDFERVVLPAMPEVAAEKERLMKCGALNVVMSGAGPTLIAFFDSEEKALDCSDEIYRIVL